MATAPPQEGHSKPEFSHELALGALSFMSAHIDEPLRLSDAADHLGYSPFHFSRVFRTATGVAPGAFLTALRFQRAKELLLHDEAAVIDVCTAVGYSSLATFTRRFQQWVGVTPAALRALAVEISDKPTSPFSMGDPRQARVEVTLEVPEHGVLQPPLVWVGWYAQPVPKGLPAAGVARHGGGVVHLPLAPGYPWLMAFTVAREAEAVEHLAPVAPVVAAHPKPITAACSVRLNCQTAHVLGPPMLSALPALRTGLHTHRGEDRW